MAVTLVLTAAPAAATASITATTCDTGYTSFEPTIGTTLNGDLFMSVERTIGPGVLQSARSCSTWSDVTPTIALGIENPPNTNDPYLHVDDGTGRVFNLHMQGLQCNWLTMSDDGGSSWTTNPLACGQPVSLQDHPTIFTGPTGPNAPLSDQIATNVGYPNMVYVCANRVVIEAACARSLDGGQTFGPWRDLVTGSGQALTDNCLSGLHAHGTTGPNGVVYLGTAVDWQSGCSGDAKPAVAISDDDGLTWTLKTLDVAGSVDNHETATAVDEAGNVYAFWIDGGSQLPRYAYSTNQGSTWSSPQTIAPSGLEDASFPTIAAGGDGNVSVAFYGTNETGSGRAWDVYMGVSTSATSSTPDFQFDTANPSTDPVATQRDCDSDNRCDGVGDFIDIVIDGQGTPWASVVDGDSGDAALVATVSSGPSLR